MKVDIRIDPACGEPAVTITAPALTDEIKALAARLEGGAALVGWDGARAVPLEEADILRCYGEEKGVRVQTPGGVYDLKSLPHRHHPHHPGRGDGVLRVPAVREEDQGGPGALRGGSMYAV